MDSKVKLSISFAIILAVIVSSNSSINWSVFSGLNSNTDPLTGHYSNSESNSLSLGYFPNVNHAQAIIGIGTGNFSTAINNSDENSNFTMNARVFYSNPSVLDALYSGKVDVAYVGPNSIIDGLILSGPEDLRIISGVSSGGASFVVRNDSGIDSVSDLGGKKFASPQLGNTQDVALRKYLVDNGFNTVDKGGNVTVLPITNADILTVFLKGEIDGAWVPERARGGQAMTDIVCMSGVELVMEYLEGALAPDVRAAVDAHVAACPRCMAFIASYKETPRILRQATAMDMPAELQTSLLAALRSQLGRSSDRDE